MKSLRYGKLAPKALLRDVISGLFFQPRVDAAGNVVPKTWRAALHQRLFERGITVPWVLSPRRCHQLWQVPAGQQGVPNRPEDYAYGPVTVMKYVLDFISSRIAHDAPILEVGCSAGSKLNSLCRAGYVCLNGLELNVESLRLMKECFPELHAATTLHAGPAEQVLPRLDDRQFVLVYSVSTLELIHPSRTAVFDHIARVCAEYILTVEIEWAGGRYFFPRNYRRVFQSRGFTQVASVLLSRRVCPEPEMDAYWGHVMRLLRRNQE